MANIRSAVKRIKISERNRVRNKAARTELKTLVKDVRQAKPKEAVEALRQVQKLLDMAASKGIIHKRQAARRVARLTRHVAAQKA